MSRARGPQWSGQWSTKVGPMSLKRFPHSGHRAGISSVSYLQEIAGQASNEEAVPKKRELVLVYCLFVIRVVEIHFLITYPTLEVRIFITQLDIVEDEVGHDGIFAVGLIYLAYPHL